MLLRIILFIALTCSSLIAGAQDTTPADCAVKYAGQTNGNTVTVRFTLYTFDPAYRVLWSEVRLLPAGRDGSFEVKLGALGTEDLTAALLSNSQDYLAVERDTEQIEQTFRISADRSGSKVQEAMGGTRNGRLTVSCREKT